MQRPNSSVGPIRPRKLEYSSRDYSREHEAEAEEEASSSELELVLKARKDY